MNTETLIVLGVTALASYLWWMICAIANGR